MIRLEKDEKILFIIRKHWFVFFVDIISVALLLLIPVTMIASLHYLKQFIDISGNDVALVATASSVVLLFIWTSIFIIWTDYYLDILILTNKHIIDVEQKGLFSRELSMFRLDKIQDITSEVNGLIPTLLKFGTIHIQTAGDDREFLVRGMPKPFEVRHRISKQQSFALKESRVVDISDDSLKKIARS